MVALQPHLDWIVLVGAQAVYLHTGDSDLSVAEYTTDADFTIEPREISDSPLIEEALTSQGLLLGKSGWMDVMPPGLGKGNKSEFYQSCRI